MPYRWFVVLISMLTLACGGEAPEEVPSGDDNTPAAEEQSPAEQSKIEVCSAQGVAADCDPVTNEGCAQGSCYVLPITGPACVCPAGTVPAGGECNTTRECAPNHGCIGETAPGTCSPYCVQGEAGGCPTGHFCDKIKPFPDYGVCAPE